MRIIVLISACLLFFGCDSQTDVKDPEETIKSEQSKPKPDAKSAHDHDEHAGHDHAGHDHTNPSGVTYKQVEPQDSCTKPTVIEFFAYQCPHCYKVESFAAEWKKANAEKVDFITVPSELGREEYVPFVLSHHAAKKLGVLDKVKPILFAVIHEKKKIESFFDVFEEAGVSRADAEAAMKDFDALRTAMESDYELMKRYKVTGVPSFLVNFQYMTDISLAGGYDKVMPTVDEMLKLENSCSAK